MDFRDLMPKSFTELFDIQLTSVFSEEQLNKLNNLSGDLRFTLENFLKDIQTKHETLKTDSVKKFDQLGKNIF